MSTCLFRGGFSKARLVAGGGSFFCCFLCCFSIDFQVTSPGPGAGTAVTVCAFDPLDANIAYVGGDCQGVMRTLDGGRSWSASNQGLINPEDSFYEAYFTIALEVDPSNPNVVYSGTQRGLYRSVDFGETWVALNLLSVAPLDISGTHVPVGAVEVDPSASNRIYIGIGDLYNHDHESIRGIVALSDDSGQTWRRIGEDQISSEAIVYDIALDPNGDDVDRSLVISTDGGVFVSHDGGASVQSFNSGLPHPKGRRLTVSRPENGPAVFYLSMFPNDQGDGGVFRWAVGEETWQDVNGLGGDSPLILSDGPPCIYNWIEAHPTNPEIVYLASAPSYVEVEQCDTESYFITTDGGATWEEQFPSPESAWVEEPPILAMLAVAPSDPSIVMGGYVTMTVSSDGGREWRQNYADVELRGATRWFRSRSQDIGSQMWALSGALDPRPEFADVMYQGHADALLFKTEDMEWFRRLAPLDVLDPLPDLAEGWGIEGDGNLTPQVSLDPGNPDIVYASANYHLYRSLNRGGTWDELTGWPNPYGDTTDEILNRDNAARFAIDPSSPPDRRTLYVTVNPGQIYKSTDGGNAWTDLTPRLGGLSNHINGVYLDPSNSQRIYLGTFSQIHYAQEDMWSLYPIFYSEDGGTTWGERGRLPLVNRIWIDPMDGNHLLAATLHMNDMENEGGLYRTDNGGVSWSLALKQPFVTDVAADPHRSDRLWALSSSYYQSDVGVDLPNVNAGLYLSEDRGLTWSRTGLELNSYMLYPLLVHPTRQNELFVGTAGLGFKRIIFSELSQDSFELRIELGTDGQLVLTAEVFASSGILHLESSQNLRVWREIDSFSVLNAPDWFHVADLSTSNASFYRLVLRR